MKDLLKELIEQIQVDFHTLIFTYPIVTVITDRDEVLKFKIGENGKWTRIVWQKFMGFGDYGVYEYKYNKDIQS